MVRESATHPDKTQMLIWSWLEHELKQKYGQNMFYIDNAEITGDLY